ncbi:cupin domain-containing protein [Chitinophaga sp. 30R24]|uniref:cupin domain-containing protein n=1 Tax=Chitinophaga sp. 30R24 TaxID=3248838 RepID=UPI003B8F89F7
MDNNFTRRNAIARMGLLIGSTLLTPLLGFGVGNENDKRNLSPFYLAPQEPLQPGPGGLNIRTWVKSAQTNMQFSCVETAVAARKMGPAPHVHDQLDELMYVVEGTATVYVAGKVQEIAVGGWHFRPRKIAHTFWNAADKPLRFFDMYFNQNFEDFLEELFHKIIPDMVKAGVTPMDPAIAKRMSDLDKKFGVTTFHEERAPLVERYGLIG